MISPIKTCSLIVLLVFHIKDGKARDLNKITTLYCTIDQEGIEGSGENGKIKLIKSNFWESPEDQTMIFDNINLTEQTARLITMEEEI